MWPRSAPRRPPCRRPRRQARARRERHTPRRAAPGCVRAVLARHGTSAARSLPGEPLAALPPRREGRARPAVTRPARRQAELAPAVDDVPPASVLLVAQPRDRPLLGDAAVAPVADALREHLLQRRPLRWGERVRVVVLLPQLLELALLDVGPDVLAGHHRGRRVAR